jgi:phosphoglycolate phosphatase
MHEAAGRSGERKRRLNLTGWTLAFDLDGTLIDTAPDLVAAQNAVLAEEGLPPVPIELARHMVGHGAGAMLDKGFAAAGVELQPVRRSELIDRFVEIYRGHIARDSRPFEGCVDALEMLAGDGATLVVCTNKRTSLSTQLLEALDMSRLFAAVVGADAAPAPKPDARHLLFTIEEADGDPDMALMIGDSRTDLDAARNAGIPVALVSFGYSDVPQRDLGADAVLDNYSELAGWVASAVSR